MHNDYNKQWTMNNYNYDNEQWLDNDNSALQCNTIITMNILLNSIVNDAYNDYNILVYYYNIVMHFTILSLAL